MWGRITIVIMLAAAPLLPVCAEEKGSDIVVKVMPYIWLPTVAGDVALGPLSVPVRVDPSDFAAGIKIGGMGQVRADVDHKFIYVDGIFADYQNANFKPFFGQGVISKIRFGEAGFGITREVRLGGERTMRLSPHLGFQHLHMNALVVGDFLNT